MPVRSRAQNRLFRWAEAHPKAAESERGIKPSVAKEFVASTHSERVRDLPERVRRKADGGGVSDTGDHQPDSVLPDQTPERDEQRLYTNDAFYETVGPSQRDWQKAITQDGPAHTIFTKRAPKEMRIGGSVSPSDYQRTTPW